MVEYVTADDALAAIVFADHDVVNFVGGAIAAVEAATVQEVNSGVETARRGGGEFPRGRERSGHEPQQRVHARRSGSRTCTSCPVSSARRSSSSGASPRGKRGYRVTVDDYGVGHGHPLPELSGRSETARAAGLPCAPPVRRGRPSPWIQLEDPVSRRSLLKGMAIAGAGVAVAELAGCSSSSKTPAPPTTTAPPPPRPRRRPPSTIPKVLRKPGSRPNPTLPEGTDTLPKIEHIVVVMMENHSFDGRFGMLGRGDGFKLDAQRQAARRQPDDGRHASLRAFHMPSTCQLNERSPDRTGSRVTPRTTTVATTASCTASGPVAMGYWDETDIPFYYGLAKTFPLCDRYFCSVLAQTYPEPAFPHRGNRVGRRDHEHLRTSPKFAARERHDLRSAASAHGISWRDYATDLPGVAVILGNANKYGEEHRARSISSTRTRPRARCRR